MADWTTLKVEHGLREGRFSFVKALLPFILGGILARGSIMGICPFGMAFGAALIIRGGRGLPLGLLGILLGTISLSLNEIIPVLRVILVLGALGVSLPLLRKRKWEGICSALLTGIVVSLVFLLLEFAKPDPYASSQQGFGDINGWVCVNFSVRLITSGCFMAGRIHPGTGNSLAVIVDRFFEWNPGFATDGNKFSGCCLEFFYSFDF